MTVKELIAELSKYDEDLVITVSHLKDGCLEDAQYKITYIAEESLSDKLYIMLEDDTD